VATLVERLSGETCPDRLGLEAELNDRIAALYGLTTDAECRLVEGLPLALAVSESEASL
jgi:hypothetical protein